MALVMASRTQLAIQSPFEPLRNPGYGGQPSVLTSTDEQNAIEEALSRAISNDRFLLLVSYGGNANSGRYLEFFPTLNSLSAPLYFQAATRVLTIEAATTASNATCTIGFFDINVSTVTPVYTVTFSNQKLVILSGSPLFTFAANAQIAVRVTSGSINKPFINFTLSAST